MADDDLPDAPWVTGRNADDSALPDAPWATPDPDAQPDMSWGDVAGQAASNLLPSAGQFIGNTAQAILHPLNTATNLYHAGHGLLQKMGVSSGEGDIDAANAVGNFFHDRYGSIHGLKHAIATDPVGVLGDVSMILTGGGSALVRAPGTVGKLGELAQAAGRVTNPLNAVTVPAKLAGTVAGKLVSVPLGLRTGVGSRSIEEAAASGYQGGQAGTDFLANLRGKVPLSDVIDDAKGSMQKLRFQRGADYRAKQQALSTATNPLSWTDIDDAMRKAGGMSVFKGQTISPEAASMRTALADTLNDWKGLNPADYHTAEGMDALKQKIWALGGDSVKPGTVESAMRGTVYNAIKDTITKQEPMYADMMSGYSKASDALRELEKTLSLGDSATTDTALRKLQSVLRDNVNTNYGQRRVLADYLVRNGSPTLMQKLAGQALSSWEPRGLARMVGYEIPWALGNLNLAHIASLPLASPRLVGEGAYYAGAMARPVGWAGRAATRAVPSARLAGEVSGAADQGAPPQATAAMPAGIPTGARLLKSPTGETRWVTPDGRSFPGAAVQ